MGLTKKIKKTDKETIDDKHVHHSINYCSLTRTSFFMVFSRSSVSPILLASMKSLYLSVGREGICCFYLSVIHLHIMTMLSFQINK